MNAAGVVINKLILLVPCVFDHCEEIASECCKILLDVLS